MPRNAFPSALASNSVEVSRRRIPCSPRKRAQGRRNGLTLLETILAMTILGVSMAVVGELVRLGARHASAARELTTAQLLCESTLQEIAAGAIAAASTGEQPCESDPEWVYSVTTAAVDQPGVIAVEVTVKRAEAFSDRPVSVTLIRWIADPEATSGEEGASS